MSLENETATPAEQATPVEQVQAVETTSAEATTAQTQAQPETPEQEQPKREPWFQKRIGELTREKYEARRAAEQAAAEVSQYREQLQRIQQGQQPEQQQPVGDVQTLVQKEAARLVAETKFNEACNKVYAAGKSEFQDFDAAVANLQMVGMSRDFLEFTAASDAGAKLLHHLGKDLDEAARISALPPVLMARELTKLELKLSQPQAKQVSKAPAPITPVTGTSGGSKDPSEMTDAEFAKWRKSQIAQRS